MRRIAAVRLRRCGFEALMDVAMLIVTELLTNALLHSGSTEISLRISVEDGCLRIAVRDGMPVSAEPRAATDTAESGRGLMIVEALAAGPGEPTARRPGAVSCCRGERSRDSNHGGPLEPPRREVGAAGRPRGCENGSGKDPAVAAF
ncbi:ATP-binding protein [Streptomyces sp. NPDC057301]|uniref:ATP-binding protein n=1 Tax=Streptomyces sp. NPDC057301 TaxID=3346093 RepID=UPI00362A8F26